jgi:opacity protein-like surface antigen
MRKLFFAALLTITVATSAFAKDVNSKNVRAVRHFNAEFKDAENVSWTMRSNFAKATYYMNGEKREVFYDLNGEMIGTSHPISLDKLPVGAKRVFAKKYDGYTVKEAIRFDGIEEGAYYISAENDKESVILKVTDSNSMSVFKKEDKN